MLALPQSRSLPLPAFASTAVIVVAVRWHLRFGVQNVRRGYYELAVEAPINRRVAVAFAGLALAI